MEREAFAEVSVHPNLMLTEHTMQQPICCMVIENAKETQLRSLDLNYIHFYQQGFLSVLLFEFQTGRQWIEDLERNLQKANLKAGMSGPFSSTASAHGCMRKAQIALSIGRGISPQRCLYQMDEYCEAALIEAARNVLAQEGFTWKDFCDASVAQIIALDEKMGTQYAQSLHAYLNYGLDMRRAAQSLGIHRNTLDYRMKRIQDLCGLDLENLNTCFELLFSFWMRDHLEWESVGGDNECIPGAFDIANAQTELWDCIERCGRKQEARETQFECRLLCVGITHLKDQERNELVMKINRLMPNEGVCAFDEDVVALLLPEREMDSFASECMPLFDEKDCWTVTTQTFLSGRMRQRLKLCRMALRAAAQRHSQTQDMCSVLFFMTLEKSMSLSPYFCEDVIRVMDEDALRGTMLSKALYAYLLNFQDMKRAANQLRVHRNTMEYQMRKIDALIGKAVGEKHRFLMMCTYKMLSLPDT